MGPFIVSGHIQVMHLKKACIAIGHGPCRLYYVCGYVSRTVRGVELMMHDIKLAERGFDPRIFGLRAQHTPTAPLHCSSCMINYGTLKQSRQILDSLWRGVLVRAVVVGRGFIRNTAIPESVIFGPDNECVIDHATLLSVVWICALLMIFASTRLCAERVEHIFLLYSFVG